MFDWDLSKIKEEDKREFIIKCLQEYIDEVNNMEEEWCYVETEILQVAELYKEIIKMLNKG